MYFKWIDNIIRYFSNGISSAKLTSNKLEGLLLGAAVGDAMGIQVTSRTPEQLAAEPISDIIGYGDGHTPGGEFGRCAIAMHEFAKYICDNVGNELDNTRFLWLCNRWYTIKIADEDRRLRLMLPCSVLAGAVFSSIGNSATPQMLPDIAADIAVAPSALMFNASAALQKYQVGKAIRRASSKTEKFCRKIGLAIGAHSESMQVVHLVLNDVADGGGFAESLLRIVNRGCHTELTGCLGGALLGLVYGGESIPLQWRKMVVHDGGLSYLVHRLENILK